MNDQRIVVTGVASGIGAGTCPLLRAQGARLTVLDIRMHGLLVLENDASPPP